MQISIPENRVLDPQEGLQHILMLHMEETAV